MCIVCVVLWSCCFGGLVCCLVFYYFLFSFLKFFFVFEGLATFLVEE